MCAGTWCGGREHSLSAELNEATRSKRATHVVDNTDWLKTAAIILVSVDGAGTFTLFSNDLLGAYFQLAPNFFGQCLVYMGQYDSFICIFDLFEFILARVRSVFGKNFL